MEEKTESVIPQLNVELLNDFRKAILLWFDQQGVTNADLEKVFPTRAEFLEFVLCSAVLTLHEQAGKPMDQAWEAIAGPGAYDLLLRRAQEEEGVH